MPHLFYCLDLQPYTWTHLHRDPGPISSVLLACLGRNIHKAQILRFATCQYIDEGHHIILKGASGNGKTYIACALGNAACRRFKKVQYIRMPELYWMN